MPFSPPPHGESQWAAPDVSTMVTVPPEAAPPAPREADPAWLGGAPLGGSEPWMEAPVAPRTPGVGLRWASGVIGVLAGTLLVASSWMTWVTADIRGAGLRNGNGWQNVYGNLSLGPIVALIGLAVAVASALVAVDVARRGSRAVLAVGCVAAVGLLIWELVDISTPGRGVTSSIGAGIWTMLAGSILAVIALVLALRVPAVVATPE